MKCCFTSRFFFFFNLFICLAFIRNTALTAFRAVFWCRLRFCNSQGMDRLLSDFSATELSPVSKSLPCQLQQHVLVWRFCELKSEHEQMALSKMYCGNHILTIFFISCNCPKTKLSSPQMTGAEPKLHTGSDSSTIRKYLRERYDTPAFHQMTATPALVITKAHRNRKGLCG